MCSFFRRLFLLLTLLFDLSIAIPWSKDNMVLTSAISLPTENAKDDEGGPISESLSLPEYKSKEIRAVPNSNNFHNSNENSFTNERYTKFTAVTYLSLSNILINSLRPDPSIIWQARVPRILWELCIFIVSKSASNVGSVFPAVYILLSFMTASTAMLDIFFWAPIFAYNANFETCDHGGRWFSSTPPICETDYVKGFGRLFVTVQCIVTGLVYMMAAIVSWGAFTTVRDIQIAERNAKSNRVLFDSLIQSQNYAQEGEFSHEKLPMR